MRLSSTLNISNPSGGTRQITCAKCGQAVGPAGEPWKHRVALNERPIKELGTTYKLQETVVLREFACPGCQALLDTEIALKDDPFLDDVLFV